MSAPSGFRLRKWYLDCVAEDGTAVIGYWARLRWGPVRLRYASALIADAPSPRQPWTLRPGPPPRIADGTCDWSCAPLRLSATWTARCAAVRRVLLRGADGHVRWHCHQPLADCSITIRRPDGSLNEMAGLGYVEELDLSVPPWRLPFRTLWWGRVTAPGASLVWIRWDGEPDFCFSLLNGRPVPGPVIDAHSVRAGHVIAHFTDSRALRDGPLATRALAGLPGLVRMLPPRFRAANERKLLSRVRLVTPDGAGDVTNGWAIHEEVRW